MKKIALLIASVGLAVAVNTFAADNTDTSAQSQYPTATQDSTAQNGGAGAGTDQNANTMANPQDPTQTSPSSEAESD